MLGESVDALADTVNVRTVQSSESPVYDVLVLVEVHCRSSRWVPARANGGREPNFMDDAMLETGIDVRRYDHIDTFLCNLYMFVRSASIAAVPRLAPPQPDPVRGAGHA